ncbi:transcription factor Tfb4-domain-containing protein, partial [Chlamydoabsidia padenii]
DDSNLLVLIIDTNPFVWDQIAKASTPLSLDDALRQILIFVNAHLALKYNNKVVVIASHGGHSKFLYPLPHREGQLQDASTNNSKRNANMYPHFQLVTDQIVEGLQDLLSDTEILKKENFTSSMTTGAFSMALCYINRITKMDDLGHIKPRILVISVSPDAPKQYIPLMNCIFSAQKMGIPVDFAFLPERYARNFLNLPSQDLVDFRAACFCHKNIIDVGFVCSVCLSIFCSWTPVCSTCKTKFAFRPKLTGRTTSKGSPIPASTNNPSTPS